MNTKYIKWSPEGGFEKKELLEAKKIIEDHGGKIWATSKESIGTVMYFVLRKYQEVPYEQSIDH